MANTLPTSAPVVRSGADRLAKIALWLVPVFLVWTAAYILLSPFIADLLGADVQDGEVVYLESWLAWTVATLLWIAPLVVGLVLAIRAWRARARLGLAALLVNAVMLVVIVAPPLADRLLTP